MSDTHSAECRRIERSSDTRYRMGDLTEEEQRIVLACPHRSHDAARFVWRVR